MKVNASDFVISKLGECRIHSPMPALQFIDDQDRVLYYSHPKDLGPYLADDQPLSGFEVAGPREKIYFDPSKLKCGIVTCGGLCPGLNDVIRAIVLSLHYHYGIRNVFGFRYGFEGLSSRYPHEPLALTPDTVASIQHAGGTILGSSRGPQEISDMVDTLDRMNVGILFTIGGDGTLRGSQAIAEEIKQRGLKIGVIAVPKTIDNDISYLHKSFGFETAVAESRTAIYSAHAEADGARNGVGLVKLMGRESGLIAANASLANSEVNFCLVPEVPFRLESFLAALSKRLELRRHGVVVVAEGAGQDLMAATHARDASGNVRFQDIGLFMKEKIKGYFKSAGVEINLKYIDPSYTIRSMPANPHDSVFCLLLGHNAVHAGMTGRTNMLVGYWNGEYTHVPIPLAVSVRKRIDPNGRFWSSVRESTGQPADMG